MIAFDTNILVYAHRQDSPFHAQAFACVKEAAEGNEAWAIPWPCVHEFLAVVTNPKIFKTPTQLEAALAQVSMWMDSPVLVLLGEEREGYWSAFCRIAREGSIKGAKIHDARVAAIALLHEVDEMFSADRDYSRFPEISLRNPLKL